MSVHETEKRAMTGGRHELLVLVSSWRKVRDAGLALLSKRYRDGECDAVAVAEFEAALSEAINDMVETSDFGA